ncbi:hypothetical protein M1843_05130 [Isoptericola sp. 4D.3]|uniref:Lipoprotein n=1 Tax=Isoptericola peretonis TaxID=2918523 RepID=A0ABT0J0W4_9MICO|nr:hypothetical protein [Isoptericola sp. 4D.3]
MTVRRARLALAATAGMLALTACAADEGPTTAAPRAPARPSVTPTPSPTPSPTPPSRGTPTAELLLATQAGRDTLAVVDPGDRRGSAVVEEIVMGTAPWDVAVVDLSTRERTDLFRYAHQPADVAFGEYRRGGLGLAVSPDGQRVHVAVSTGDAAHLETLDAAPAGVDDSYEIAIPARPQTVVPFEEARP